jgi:hypothetical protein
MRFLLMLLTAVFAVFAIDLHAATVVSTAASAAPHGVLFYVGVGSGIAVFGATLSTGALTLADWAKRQDPQGKVPTIVELLSQTNEILLDMRWLEGNLPTGHRTTVRTGLPTVAWRLLNQGVSPSKSTTAQIDEQCGMLEAWSEVDKDLAMLNGDVAAFRLSEARAFLEAMNQEMAQTLFYGNAGLAPEEFTGLSPRYSALSGAGNSANVLSAGGSGSDNSSIWLIVWGENSVHGIFPKGSKAGLLHEDFGEVTAEVTAGVGGSRMRAFQERFQWKAGVALKDHRFVARICNIDISDTVASTTTQATTAATRLFRMMAKAVHRIPALALGTPVFYMNRTVIEFLDIQSSEDVKSGGGLTFQNIDGKRRADYRGIPVRLCDQLLESEAAVS